MKGRNKNTILVMLSGGLDSSLVAFRYKKIGWDVSGVYYYYGQPWNFEVDAASRVADYLDIRLDCVDLPDLPILKKNFVPMRNAFMLSYACAKAYENGIAHVGIGSNRGEFLDQAGEFIDRFNFMLDYCFVEDYHPIVYAPFCNWSKERLVKYAIREDFPVEITVSCMMTGEKPCGECAICRLRKKYGIKPERRDI